MRLSSSFFHMLFLMVICNAAAAQPGWRNMDETHHYSITDQSNRLINFKTDPGYTIMINGHTFKAPFIPADTLTMKSCCTDKFYRQVIINDCSYVFPLSDSIPDIAVLHGNDSMHLSLCSQTTLVFEDGYFYLPFWAAYLFGNDTIKTDGATIVNRQQDLFKIDQKLFNAYLQRRRNNELQAEAQVKENFINASLRVKLKEANIAIHNRMPGYKGPYWSSSFYKTPDSNVYAGLVFYTLDTNNTSISKSVFSLFDKKESTLRHWMPNNDPALFYEDRLWYNEHRQIFYISAGTRTSDKDPYTEVIYYSADYGRHWKISSFLTKLFKKYDLREMEFPDNNTLLLFKRSQIYSGTPKQTEQGTYYLLQDDLMTDSLKTPDHIYYNSNYDGYRYSQTDADTAFLGAWGIHPENMFLPFSSVRIIKQGDRWRFNVTEDAAVRKTIMTQPGDEITAYRNFKLINNKKLQFADGYLMLNEEVEHIIEKNELIFIIQTRYTLVSFDAGRHWAYYPEALNNRNNYTFLNIDDLHNLSFYDMGRMKKLTYRFMPK